MSYTIFWNAVANPDKLELKITAGRRENLDELVSGTISLWDKDDDSLYVDGASLEVVDSAEMIVAFDPVGAASGGADALITAGKTYYGDIEMTWLGGRSTGHPAKRKLYIIVT